MKNFIILIIFLLAIFKTKSETPDLDCMNSVFASINPDVSKFVTRGASYDFCASNSVITCDTDQNIISLELTAKIDNTVLPTDSTSIFCFKSLKTFTLSNYKISTNFISTADSYGITTLNLYKATGVIINSKLNNIKSLNLQTNDQVPAFGLSNLSNLKQFTYDQYSPSGSILFTNDLSGISNSFDVFNFTIANAFPDLKNLNTETMQIKATSGTSSSLPITNFDSFTGVKNLIMLTYSGMANVAFPSTITSLKQLVSFQTDFGFTNSLSSQIDLSQLTLLKSFNISTKNIGSIFKYSVNPAISKYPASLETFIVNNHNTQFKILDTFYGLNVKTLVLKNCYLTTVQSSYPNPWNSSLSITSLDLSGNINLFTGFSSLDSSFCQVNFKIAGGGYDETKLQVPTCYSCHFQNSNFMNSAFGQLTLANYPDCTTLIPNASPTKNDGVITIYGSDMGFDGSWISSTLPGNTAWVVDVNSKQLHTNNNYTGIFDITYSSTKGGSQTFTLTNVPMAPLPKQVIQTTPGFLTITGSYFSYDISQISVSLAAPSDCVVQSKPTFYTVVCKHTLSSNPPPKLSYITVNGLKSPLFTVDLSQVNTYTDCPNNCSGHGKCDIDTGKCSCDDGYLGDQCSPPKTCQICQNGGSCNQETGVCSCPSNYADESCSTPVQYISSVLQINSTSDGYVNINIYGWFGLVHNDNSVYIGNSQCNINSITESLVECKVIQGEGQQVVNMTQNGISATASFFFSNPIKTCPNNCNNHGQCNSTNGLCTCSTGYQGFDCAVKNNTDTPGTSIEHGEGNTSFLNENSNFTISVVSLDEISIDKKVIISHPLSNNWGNKSYSNNIYTFTQKLIQNNNANITLNIEEITVAEKQFSFAGDTFTLKNGSLKISISIKNYTFQSSLNTLELVFLSSVQSESQCNQQDFKVDNINNLETSNYITISRDKKTLYGSFYKKVVSDDRPTFSPSTVVQNESNSSVIVRLSLPHCTQECLIDPDFSLLVDNDFESTCDSGRPKWLLPVAIVVPCVGLAAIIIVSSIIYKKHKIQFKVMKVKLKELNKST